MGSSPPRFSKIHWVLTATAFVDLLVVAEANHFVEERAVKCLALRSLIKVFSGFMAEISKIQKTEEEWQKELTPEQYAILRKKGTEPAFSGALYRNHADGMYHCAACGAELFKSDTKFESGSGWPSFFLPADQSAIETHEDVSYGMTSCRTCRIVKYRKRPHRR